MEDFISYILRGIVEVFDKFEINIEEVVELLKARRIRKNSYVVSGVLFFVIFINLIFGCSKELDSVENSDSEVFIRKRIRVKF